jgi:hypothetical protein
MADPIFKKPDGTYVTVPANSVELAQTRGYVPATEEEAAAGAQTGQAALEGVARGATLGFGDELVGNIQSEVTGKSRAEVMEGMRLRKQENPKAALAGEVGGNIGLSLATGGGPSALVGGGFKGAMLEGGLAGLGQVISESSLDKSPLTLEKMAAGMASGSLAAGGISAGMNVLGKGASAGLKKLGGGTISEVFKKAADDAEWRALTESNKGWADKNAPFKDAILKFGRENGIIGHAGAALDEETAKKASQVAASFSDKITGHMDDLERMVPLKGNRNLRIKLVDTVNKALDQEYASRPVFDSAVSDAKRITSKLIGDDKLSWRDAWKVQSDLFKDLSGVESPPATKQVRETLRQAMRDFVFDEVGTKAPGIAPGFGAAMRKTGSDSRAAMALSKALSNRASSLGSSGGVSGLGSLKSGAMGMMLGMASGNPLVGLATAAADTQLRKRGGLVLGSVLRKLGDSGSINSIANGLQGRVAQVLANAPAMLGAARIPIEAAFGRGAMDLLSEHVRIANGPEGGQYLAALGMTNETPEEVENVGARLASMDALHSAQSGLDARIDQGIDSVLGTKRGPVRPYKAMNVSDFEDRTNRLREMLADPTKAFAEIPPELDGAPSTSAELVNKLLQGASFLNAKAPKDPYEGLPTAIKPTWKPSRAEVSRWYRYVEAIEQPERMLEKMSQGTFTLEHRDALQAVYPELYVDIKTRMYERLATWDKPLDYGKKAMLAQFFGTSVLGLKPGALQILQQSFAPKQEDMAPSKGGSRPDGREVVDADKNALTQAQRIESKGSEDPS